MLYWISAVFFVGFTYLLLILIFCFICIFYTCLCVFVSAYEDARLITAFHTWGREAIEGCFFLLYGNTLCKNGFHLHQLKREFDLTKGLMRGYSISPWITILWNCFGFFHQLPIYSLKMTVFLVAYMVKKEQGCTVLVFHYTLIPTFFRVVGVWSFSFQFGQIHVNRRRAVIMFYIFFKKLNLLRWNLRPNFFKFFISGWIVKILVL